MPETIALEDLRARVAALEKNHLVLLGRHGEHEEAVAELGRASAEAPSVLDRITDLERRLEQLEERVRRMTESIPGQ